MIIKVLFLAIYFLSNFLHANLEPYLKPALNKGNNHTIEGIDFIYMINLDKRPEKFLISIEILAPYNITPYRFSAVNGWELPVETLNSIGVKYDKSMKKNLTGSAYLPKNKGCRSDEKMHTPGRNYVCHTLSPGAIGCALSHISVLHDAYKSNYQRIWVMEDDIDVKRNPHLITAYIEKLNALVGKDNWDILFTDQDYKDNDTGVPVLCKSYNQRPNFTPLNPKRFKQRIKVDDDFIKTGARYGAHSMIIQKSGIKKLLDFFNHYKIFWPYDIDYYAINDIQLYTVSDDIVSNTPKSGSDNGKPRYQQEKG